jgi:hypothetical protein
MSVSADTHVKLSQENIWPLNVLFIKIICPRGSKQAKPDKINEHKSRNVDRAKTGIFSKWSHLKHFLSLTRLKTKEVVGGQGRGLLLAPEKNKKLSPSKVQKRDKCLC